MCSTVTVVRNGQPTPCETVGQLALALGVDPGAVSDDPPEFCLCNANWQSLGARRIVKNGQWGNSDFVIELTDDRFAE